MKKGATRSSKPAGTETRPIWSSPSLRPKPNQPCLRLCGLSVESQRKTRLKRHMQQGVRRGASIWAVGNAVCIGSIGSDTYKEWDRLCISTICRTPKLVCRVIRVLVGLVLRWCGASNLFVDARQFNLQTLCGKTPCCALSCGVAKSPSQIRIGDQSKNRVRQVHRSHGFYS